MNPEKARELVVEYVRQNPAERLRPNQLVAAVLTHNEKGIKDAPLIRDAVDSLLIRGVIVYAEDYSGLVLSKLHPGAAMSPPPETQQKEAEMQEEKVLETVWKFIEESGVERGMMYSGSLSEDDLCELYVRLTEKYGKDYVFGLEFSGNKKRIEGITYHALSQEFPPEMFEAVKEPLLGKIRDKIGENIIWKITGEHANRLDLRKEFPDMHDLKRQALWEQLQKWIKEAAPRRHFHARFHFTEDLVVKWDLVDPIQQENFLRNGGVARMT